MRRLSASRARLVLTALACLAVPASATAQLQWGPNGSGGDGIWTASAATINWFNGTSNVAWDNATPASATFGSTAGTVTIDNSAGNVQAAGLTFITTGYTLAGGPLTLAGTAPTIGVGASATDVATINAALAGAAPTVTGPGLLVLGASNTFAGTLTVSAGTVRLANAGALNSTTPIGVAFGSGSTGTLQLNGNGVTIAALTATASASGVTVQNANATAATLTINQNTDTIFQGVISDGTGGGALSLLKTGTGTLTLQSATNTYTGTVTVTGGTLSVNADARLGAVPGSATAGLIVLNGGALQGTAAFTINANRGIALGPTSGTGGGTFNITTTGTDTYSGIIANNGGTGTLTKIGGGTLSLGGVNTYSGTTTISEGVITATAASALGTTAGNTTVASGAALQVSGTITIAEPITLNSDGISGGGALRKSAGANTTTMSGAITVASAARINSDVSGGTLAITGAVNVGANNLTVGGASNATIGTTTSNGLLTMTGTLNKDGAGTLTLGNTSNSFTGAVNITGGVVAIPSSLALGTNGTVTVDNGGAMRNTNSGNAGSFLSATRAMLIGINGGTVDYSPSGTDFSFVTVYTPSVAITGTGVLTKTGVGEWRYNGAARANTTFGKLVVNQGLYRLGDSGAGNNFETGFGAVPASFTADAITLNGGVLGTSYAETINTNRGLTLGAKGGTVAQTVASGTLTVPSVITGAGSFTIGNNAGTSASTTLTGVNTYTGPTAVAGSVSVASLANGGAASAIGMSTSAASNLVLDGGTLTYTGGAVSTDRLFSITSGGGTIANNGSGAIAFTNTGANPSTDKGVTNFTVTSGAVNLVLNSTTGTPFDLIGIAAGMGVSGTGIPAGDTVSSVSSTRAQFNLATAATATTANTPITFTDVNRTLTLAGSNAGANTIAGVLADSPTKALALTKSGAGTWVLSGANTYSGATTVSAGTLMAGAANTFPSVSAVSVSSGAILDLFGFSQVIGSLAGAGNVSLGGGKLTAGGSNGSTAHSGVISGAGGSLTKTGSGMLTLIGINTYTGGTTVSAGILAANTAVSGTNSATGTGPVIINNGAILAGTGAVGGTAGDVALNASVLNPGVANAGTLTALGNVTLNGGAGSNWIVGINSISSGPAANPLSLTNATGLLNIVTSSATYNIEFEAVSGPAFVQGTPVTYTIATAPAIQQSGLAFGNGTTGFTFSSTSIQFQNASLSVSGNNLQLTFTPVPEPAFVLLACGAASGAAGWWRRWRN